MESVEHVLEKYIPENELKYIKRILYGNAELGNIQISSATLNTADKNEFEIKGYKFPNDQLTTRQRLVRICALQHKIILPTSESIIKQRNSIYKHVEIMINCAAECNVNILCLPETWMMPFGFCTTDIEPWRQYAESAENGPTVCFIQELAKRHNMVIISPIMERDENGIMWNTAVVVNSTGNILGKTRKNHIPRLGDCNEAAFFLEGNTGHRVFQTNFGKIAVNICYGRHHPQNWMMYGINGAEIVFNPAATEGLYGAEPTWWVEARNAAISNSYYTCSVNRVGIENFDNEFTIGDGTPARKQSGIYFGSSYISGPDGTRTPGLSRFKEGLLIADIDLNLCQKFQDEWGFRATQRLDLYAKSLTEAIRLDYVPPIIN